MAKGDKCKNCGNKILDPKQKLYCDTDCRIAFNKKKGTSKKIISRLEQNKKYDDEGYHDCICPGCGTLHQVKIYWTGGSVKPRVRCKSCKGLAVYRENQGVVEHTMI